MNNAMERKGLLSFLSTQLTYSKLSNINSPAFAVIKGEPLSMYAYGTSGRRICADVDILIDKQNLSLLIETMQKNGYIFQNDKKNLAVKYSHQTPAMYSQINGIYSYIDINFDLFWGEYLGKRINVSEFICDRKKMNIYGYEIPTVSPIKMLIIEILHHYKDMNSIYKLSQNSIRKQMFDDIYFLLINNTNTINLEDIVDLCKVYDISKYAYFVFYYTNLVHKNEMLEKLIKYLYSKEANVLLNYYGLSDKERKAWKVSFAQRLEKNTYELIKDDLTEEDRKKLYINRVIFEKCYFEY